MPKYHVTAQTKEISNVVWDGEADSRQQAEQQMRRLLDQARSGEDLSQSGLQIFTAHSSLGNVRAKKMDPVPERTKAEPTRPKQRLELPDDRHPLYLLHTAWRSLTPQEQRQFLLEMLTPNQRRFLARGFDEDEEDE